MIHRPKEDESRDKVNVFIFGDVSNDTVINLKNLLEKEDYDTTIVAKEMDAQLTDVEYRAVLLVSENGDHPIPQRVEDGHQITKIGALQLPKPPTFSRSTLRGNYADIIGRSARIIEILKQIDKVANTTAKVLIRGETGTGKELIARALHENSDRSANRMVSVNCAAIPEPLLESELFGHEKGAFTNAQTRHIGKFERANNSTLFLDEIGDMPLYLQVKLLRAVESGEIERLGGTHPVPVDVRVIAATHCNIEQAVANGTFRQDLYYRLNVISIALPPLRERPEDIRLLAKHFVEKHSTTYARWGAKILPETFTYLQNYPWPGNVRELENALIHAILFSHGEHILPMHLSKEILAFQKSLTDVSQENHESQDRQAVTIPLGTTIRTAEETVILDTLMWQDGNRARTAKILGISLRTLQSRLKDYKESGRIPAAL